MAKRGPGRGLSADPDHVRRGQRRPCGHGSRERLAPPSSRGGHRSGIRHAVRGVGPCNRGAGCGVHRDAGCVRRPGLPGGAVQLLYHRRLRRRVAAGVPDLPERLRVRGYPAPYRRDAAFCFQRRVRHDVGVGPVGLFEGHGHPGKRQLCHPARTGPKADGGGPPPEEPVREDEFRKEEGRHEEN
ncbi:hypothetical protein SDC9_105035 [bioreactor metagenome]|uniref:Uncharacterized protein n=1 Tax=bioreactor metagenome TaxID=1076179 RepID=A0A645AY81_9ZZZZ